MFHIWEVRKKKMEYHTRTEPCRAWHVRVTCIFTWQNHVCVRIEITVSFLLGWFNTSSGYIRCSSFTLGYTHWHNFSTAITTYFRFPFTSLCAHRTCESMPHIPHPALTPAQVGGRSSFWEAQLCATTRLCERLLFGGARSSSTTS
jgi:hypothetical protein